MARNRARTSIHRSSCSLRGDVEYRGDPAATTRASRRRPRSRSPLGGHMRRPSIGCLLMLVASSASAAAPIKDKKFEGPVSVPLRAATAQQPMRFAITQKSVSDPTKFVMCIVTITDLPAFRSNAAPNTAQYKMDWEAASKKKAETIAAAINNECVGGRQTTSPRRHPKSTRRRRLHTRRSYPSRWDTSRSRMPMPCDMSLGGGSAPATRMMTVASSHQWAKPRRACAKINCARKVTRTTRCAGTPERAPRARRVSAPS